MEKDKINTNLDVTSNNEQTYLEELGKSRRELKKKLSALQIEHNKLKKKISILANLLLPGMGYYIIGKGTVKGIISFLLWISANVFYHMNNVYQEYSFGIMYFLFYIPAILVSIISTFLMTDYLD